ncbi:MAG: aspartate aminotransferase family protein [Dongiaceae bacterium]
MTAIARNARFPRPAFGGPQDLFYPRKTMVDLPTIVRGEGIHLWDDAGNRYIDVIAGAMCNNLGQGNQRVIEAAAAQARKLTFTYVRYARHAPNMELARRVTELAGPGFERALFVSGGSEANDMAVKFLRQYAVAKGETRRTRMISLMPSYHGNTLGTLALSGDTDLDATYAEMVPFSTKIPAPLTYRLSGNRTAEQQALATAEALEAAILKLGPETVLGFIMEPVGGVATGANVAPDAYYGAVRRICTRYGIRLVYDEVMSACRSGKFLAAHYWPEGKPDIVVMAKGIGAGYAPLGAMLASAAMVDELADMTGFNPSHTYNANPIACAAGCAVIDETIERDLIGNAARTGAHLKRRLEELKERSPIVGDVRGIGMLCAVELVADQATKAMIPPEMYIADRLRLLGLEHGLILYARRQCQGRYGEWTMICPPLIVAPAEADEIVERFERTLGALADALKAEGAIR